MTSFQAMNFVCSFKYVIEKVASNVLGVLKPESTRMNRSWTGRSPSQSTSAAHDIYKPSFG